MSSIYIIPTQESYRPQGYTFGRCGPSATSHASWQLDPHGHSNAIRRSFFGATGLFDEDDDVTFTDIARQHHIEQIRRQQHLEELQRRRAIQQRQQQLEQERVQRERAIRREKAARIAWQREQERRAAEAAAQLAAYEEYQHRVAAHRRHQQEQYAERRRLAAEQQKEWQRVAQQSLFGIIDLVEHLFGEDDDVEDKASTSTARKEEKKPEKAADPQGQEQSEKMQVDEEKSAHAQQSEQQKDAEVTNSQSVNTNELNESNTTTQNEAEAVEQAPPADKLVFTYPLPSDKTTRSQIRAEDVHVYFDKASNTIQLAGLWGEDSHNDSASSSTVSSNGESRGRKRSRSPKRSRVSDVDEKTGEEIVKPEDDEEYVEVEKATPTATTPTNSVQKSIRLPEGASINGLRAEITDEGFKVWVS